MAASKILNADEAFCLNKNLIRIAWDTFYLKRACTPTAKYSSFKSM